MASAKSDTENLESYVLEGNLAEVDRLIRDEAKQSLAYYEVLEKAITSGQIEAAKLLINRGCLLNKPKAYYTKPSILHLAVETGDASLVKLLIENEARMDVIDINYIPPHFYIVHLFSGDFRCFQLLHCFPRKRLNENERVIFCSIVHYAAQRGNAAIIPLLLAKNCQKDKLTGDGSTALHIAVENKHSAVVKMLLTSGANPHLLDKKNMTPLSLAVKNQDIEISEILINVSCSKKRQRNSENDAKGQFFQREENKQLVYLATSSGNVALLKMLLSHTATPNYHDPATGQTPLHLAVENQDLPIVNVLLKHVNLTAFDKQGFTPFHTACRIGNTAIVSAFLNDECQLNATSKTGLTPLHLAVQGGHSEVVTLLLKCGANCDFDANGKTVLSFALESIEKGETILPTLLAHMRQIKQDANFLMPVEKLVEKYNANVKETGESILHLAIEKLDEADVGLILEHNACMDLRNKKGLTAFESATINASVPIINLFLQREDRSFFGDAMQLAVENGNTDILELFFKSGISVNFCKKDGMTPLHLAVRKNDKNLVLWLLKNGAKVDAPGRDDFETPLFTAAETGSEIAEIFVDAYVTNGPHNLKEEWKDGYLSMYIAAYRGHEQIVKILLDAGVNPNSNFEDYLTPLHAAAQQGHEPIVRLLLKHRALVNIKYKSNDVPVTIEPYKINHLIKYCDKNVHFSTALLAAAFGGHTSIVQLLLLHHGADFNAQLKEVRKNDSVSKKQVPGMSNYKKILTKGSYDGSQIIGMGALNGYTSLHFAVKAKNEEMVKLLLESGARINYISLNDLRVIDIAILNEDENIMEMISSAGDTWSNFSFKEHEQRYGQILKTNVRIAEIIVKYVAASETSRLYPNVTPLGIAVENRLEKCVKKFLDSGVDVNIEHKGMSLLFFALGEDNLEIVKMLVNHGIDVNATDKEGNSPLMLAIKNKYLDVIELLLDAKADTELPQTSSNDSKPEKLKPLDYAISQNNAKIVEMFFERGCVGTGVDFSFRLALEKSSIWVVEKFVNYGVSVHKTLFGKSPIYYAIVNNNVEVVEFLLKKGASLRADEKDGHFPLHVALSNLFYVEKLIQVLIKYGFNLNTKNEKDKTPVCLILEKFCNKSWPSDKIISILKLLLANGADMNRVYFYECTETLLNVAMGYAYPELVEYLLINGVDVNLMNSVKEVPLKRAIDDVLGFVDNSDNEDDDDDDDDDFKLSISKICFLLVEEVTRKAASGNINEQNRLCLAMQRVGTHYKSCQEEIQTMKTKIACEEISFFDILKASPRKLSFLTRNDNFELILSSEEITHLFPIYAKFLIHRIKSGRERRRLLDSGFILLEKVLCFKFPLLIVDMICSFLTDRDLNNFINAFNKDMFF